MASVNNFEGIRKENYKSFLKYLRRYPTFIFLLYRFDSMFMHAFAFIFVMQANAPEIRSFDDAIVMLSSANQSENTTVSTCVYNALCVFFLLLTIFEF